MKSILITGYKGTIGQILYDGLYETYAVTGADLPENDLTDYRQALTLTKNKDIVIHLAWDTISENYSNGWYDPGNSHMFYNIYEAAYQNGVKRLIMASSIHAQNFYTFPADSVAPSFADSIYGANKIFLEQLGGVYSKRGIEVICVRFGSINLTDTIDLNETFFERIWLSKRDCLGLISRCIDADCTPNNFTIINAVSDNLKRIHDISNPFGWLPADDAAHRSANVKA